MPQEFVIFHLMYDLTINPSGNMNNYSFYLELIMPKNMVPNWSNI